MRQEMEKKWGDETRDEKKNGEMRRMTQNKIGRQDGRREKNGEMGRKMKKNGR